MSPRKKAQLKKEQVTTPEPVEVPEVNLTKALEEQPVSPIKVEEPKAQKVETAKPFIEVEEYKPVGKLDAYFTDPVIEKTYRLRWLEKSVLGSNRSGIWHVIDKKHDHFKPSVLHVEVDHTPNKTYYSVDELVLCVTRSETAANKREKQQQITNSQTRSIEETLAVTSERALSDAGLEPQRKPTFGQITERRGNQRPLVDFR